MTTTATVIHCVQFQISWQLMGKGDNRTDDIQTSGSVRSLRLLALSDTDCCMILLVLGE